MEGHFLKAKQGIHSMKWISSHNHRKEVDAKKTILRLVQPVKLLNPQQKRRLWNSAVLWTLLPLFLSKCKNVVWHALMLWGWYSKNKGLCTEDMGRSYWKIPRTYEASGSSTQHTQFSSYLAVTTMQLQTVNVVDRYSYFLFLKPQETEYAQTAAFLNDKAGGTCCYHCAIRYVLSES
jgi:hypothetical protein